MRRLHDYLDYHLVKIILKNGEQHIGATINVNYADESNSGEDELVIENEIHIIGFAESEIESVEILDEIED